MALQHDTWIKRVFGVVMPGTAADPAASDIFGSSSKGALSPGAHAAGLGRPVPRAGLGSAQINRARDLGTKMPHADRQRIGPLISNAPEEERPYLIKALASGHSAAELMAFHAQIAGKPRDWLQNNLHLVGKTNGKGIKQQWAESCVPTTVEAMRGELDPVYALRTNQANPNLTRADDTNAMRLNPKLAIEQKNELTDSMSSANNRNMLVTGGGEDNRDILKHLSGVTGLKFDVKDVGFSDGPMQAVLQELKSSPKMHKALENIKSSLIAGLPVPVSMVQVVGRPGHEQAIGGHQMLCTGYDPGPPPRYSMHEPTSGNTVIVTEDDLRKGDLHLGDSGYMILAGFYKPTAFK